MEFEPGSNHAELWQIASGIASWKCPFEPTDFHTTFGHRIDSINFLQHLYRTLSIHSQAHFPEFTVTPYLTQARRLQEFLNGLSNKVIDPNERKQKHERLTQILEWHNLNMIGLVAYVGANTLDTTSAVNSSKEQLGQLNTLIEQSKTALQMVQTEATKKKVSAFSSSFQTLADKNASSSKWWLFISVITFALGIATLTLFPAVFETLISPITDSNHYLMDYLGSKAITVSVLYFLGIFCIRNYRTNKHQESINRHKKSALETFEAFVNNANADQQTKDAVLLETTRCIFSIPSTGYLGKEESHLPAIEILQKISGKP